MLMLTHRGEFFVAVVGSICAYMCTSKHVFIHLYIHNTRRIDREHERICIHLCL